MKVLQKICPHCGYLMLFSVTVLCRPGTTKDIGPRCPSCGTAQSVAVYATEIDIAEAGPDIDVEAVERSIARFTTN